MSRAADREAEGREACIQALEQVCPRVYGNPWIPHWPLPAQQVFLGLHLGTDEERVFQALYGGSAGGGKSDALLMAAAQYAWNEPDFAGILFRRTFTDLTQPGALLDRAMEWWVPKGAHWDGTNKVFKFPGGGKLAFAYLFKPNDHLRYQGAEYQFTGWDELTQWPTAAPYEYVGLSRVRRPSGSRIPLRTLAASNPGGPGHDWVARQFIGGTDPDTGEHVGPRHVYVPARISDNPFLDRDAYVRGLEHLHPTVRQQLLEGDWAAREPGDYFRAEWFGPLLDPEVDRWPSSECQRIRWWDLAASEKSTAAKTAGVLMARHRRGVRAIEHCRSFRATPGKRDDLIVQTAQGDGHGVTVGLEIEGGSGGLAQFHALEKRLRTLGFRVVGARPSGMTDREQRSMTRGGGSMSAKTSRADPVASCLERGYQRRGEGPDTGAPWHAADAGVGVPNERDGIRLFSGPWTADYLSIVEGFPDAATCDEVDATSGAWAWLEAHPLGARQPFGSMSAERNNSSHDLHPDDRPQPSSRWLTP